VRHFLPFDPNAHKLTGFQVSEARAKHLKEKKMLRKKLKRKADRAEWKKANELI